MRAKGKVGIADMHSGVTIWRTGPDMDKRKAQLTPPFEKLAANFLKVLIVVVITQIGNAFWLWLDRYH